MIVFDTDILSLFGNGHAGILDRMNRLAADDLPRIVVVTRIEILSGLISKFEKAKEKKDLRQEMSAMRRFLEAEEMLNDFDTLPIDEAAPTRFDELQSFIKENKLRPRGRNDLWIAAVALANSAVLVTRNVGDFRGLPGLTVENWAD